MKHFAKSLASLLLIAFGSIANATVITFEDISPLVIQTQTSQGFVFSSTLATADIVSVTTSAGAPCTPNPCSSNGTQSLFVYNADLKGPFQVEMRTENGAAFQLLAFDFSELFNFTVAPGELIKLSGRTTSGSTLTTSFEYDLLPNSFQTAQVVGFTDLTSVLFTSDRYFPAYDNIVANAVPVPSTLVLCLLTFAGAGLMSRRSKV